MEKDYKRQKLFLLLEQAKAKDAVPCGLVAELYQVSSWTVVKWSRSFAEKLKDLGEFDAEQPVFNRRQFDEFVKQTGQVPLSYLD